MLVKKYQLYKHDWYPLHHVSTANYFTSVIRNFSLKPENSVSLAQQIILHQKFRLMTLLHRMWKDSVRQGHLTRASVNVPQWWHQHNSYGKGGKWYSNDCSSCHSFNNHNSTAGGMYRIGMHWYVRWHYNHLHWFRRRSFFEQKNKQTTQIRTNFTCNA